MLTVEQVVRGARDLNPAFDRRRIPDGSALRFLSRYQRRLVSTIVQVHPQAIMSPYTIDLPLIIFEDGEDLPDYHYLHGGNVIDTAGHPCELTIVDWSHRLQAAPFPASWVQEGTLYLAGEPADWTGFVRIELSYTPVPAELTSFEATFDALEDWAEDVLVTQLGAFMARRVKKDLEPAELQEIVGEAATAEGAYIDEVTGRKRAQSSTVKEVW